MPLKPALGWTLLSPSALKKANDALSPDSLGVVDEVGFLALHRGYADRFFPGTSVLHTRLRYVLFVPWIYEDLQAVRKGNLHSSLQERERQLAHRLNQGVKAARDLRRGVIGGDVYPKPAVQPPSAIYWSALGQWGILRQRAGAVPSRAQVHRSWSPPSPSKVKDDDQVALDEVPSLFVPLPPRPERWQESNALLHFKLEEPERAWLRDRLTSVRSPLGDPSLLARLAAEGFDITEKTTMFDEDVLAAASPRDREALGRARQAASLAAIGRAVYAAQVEHRREQDGHEDTPRTHRDYLDEVLEEHQAPARALELDAVRSELELDDTFVAVLQALQRWLGTGTGTIPAELEDALAQAEWRRKQRRARLPQTGHGKERREDWSSDDYPAAQPLHYRWPRVHNLLLDLAGR